MNATLPSAEAPAPEASRGFLNSLMSSIGWLLRSSYAMNMAPRAIAAANSPIIRGSSQPRLEELMKAKINKESADIESTAPAGSIFGGDS